MTGGGCGRAGGGCPGCGLRSLAGPRGECGAAGPAPSGPRSRRPCPGGGAPWGCPRRGPGAPCSEGPRAAEPGRGPVRAAPPGSEPPQQPRPRHGGAGSVPPGPVRPRHLPAAGALGTRNAWDRLPFGGFPSLFNRVGVLWVRVPQRSPRASTKAAGVPSPTHLAAADRLPDALLTKGQVWPSKSSRSGNLGAAHGKPKGAGFTQLVMQVSHAEMVGAQVIGEEGSASANFQKCFRRSDGQICSMSLAVALY